MTSDSPKRPPQTPTPTVGESWHTNPFPWRAFAYGVLLVAAYLLAPGWFLVGFLLGAL